MDKERKWLTTGQAAELCSVTPDAVLKWIKAGRVPARRTAGGHYRILDEDLALFRAAPEVTSRGQPYCWEYLAGKQATEDCVRCVVYRLRVKRCYELRRWGVRTSELRCGIPCQGCDYFVAFAGRARTRLLVVTGDPDLTLDIAAALDPGHFEARFCGSGYECAALLSRFRADAILFDLDVSEAESLVRHLAADPRLAGVRILFLASRVERGGAAVAKPVRQEELEAALRRAPCFEGLPADALQAECAAALLASLDRERDAALCRILGVPSLTDEHWRVLEFVRAYYQGRGAEPTVEEAAAATGLDAARIVSLFPCSLVDGSLRLAGPPRVVPRGE